MKWSKITYKLVDACIFLQNDALYMLLCINEMANIVYKCVKACFLLTIMYLCICPHVLYKLDSQKYLKLVNVCILLYFSLYCIHEMVK